jgi:hypothetical protein
MVATTKVQAQHPFLLAVQTHATWDAMNRMLLGLGPELAAKVATVSTSNSALIMNGCLGHLQAAIVLKTWRSGLAWCSLPSRRVLS